MPDHVDVPEGARERALNRLRSLQLDGVATPERVLDDVFSDVLAPAITTKAVEAERERLREVFEREIAKNHRFAISCEEEGPGSAPEAHVYRNRLDCWTAALAALDQKGPS